MLDALAERIAVKVAARLAEPTPAPVRLAYTVTEAAEILGLSERSMWRLVARGEIAAVDTPGTRRRLIPAAELQRLIDDGAA